jgi:hypothetical protein
MAAIRRDAPGRAALPPGAGSELGREEGAMNYNMHHHYYNPQHPQRIFCGCWGVLFFPLAVVVLLSLR